MINAILIAAQLAAQPLCGPAPEVKASLQTRFGERPVWSGITKRGQLVLMESRSGSWTLIIMPNDDVACLIGTGHGSKVEFGEPI